VGPIFLLVCNILAGVLVELALDFAKSGHQGDG